MQGYIKLYRKTMCSPIWQDPYYLKLWMYCLMKASHREHKQLVGNQLITLQPGEFVTGRTALSEDLNKGMKPNQKINELSWWRHLNNLEKWEMLNIKKTNKYSVVSIVKWVEYQEAEQQVNNNRTTDEQQLNTNKNVKNVKNDKNDKKSNKKNMYAEFVSMTSDEYEKLLEEFGDKGSAERIEKLNLYKGSTGKKYKSDYLTILNWERKNKPNQQKKSIFDQGEESKKRQDAIKPLSAEEKERMEKWEEELPY